MMRRDLIAGLLLAATMARAKAQQTGKMYRIVIINPLLIPELSETSSDRYAREFFKELRRLGYVQGQNLLAEGISGHGRSERYPELVHDVVGRSPDVIIAISNPLVQAFKEATASIPIIAVVSDPVATGIVPSLARPGGNVTGVSGDPGLQIWGKRLELLREVVPSMSKVGFLATLPGWEGPYAAAVRGEVQRAGMSIIGPPLDVADQEAEYRRVLGAMVQQGAEGLLVSEEVHHYVNRQWIADLARDFRLPAIYANPEQVEVGGLMAYTLDGYALWRHAAGQVDQILRGTKPGEIAFWLPRKFDLIINLKTAKALGLTIPTSLLASADEVIE